MEIVQIVPRLPPAIDGVGDYAFILARQLRVAHGIQTRFVVCGAKSRGVGSREQGAGSGPHPQPLSPGTMYPWSARGANSGALTPGPSPRAPCTHGRRGEEALDGFPVYQLSELSAAELTRVLSQSGMPRTALLQYVGYGYEKRGCPLWLVRGLEAWKRGAALTPGPSPEAEKGTVPFSLIRKSGQSPRTRRLVTMFHELYASGPPWRSSFWTSAVQRWVARCLARQSDRCFTNRAASGHWLSSVSGMGTVPVRVLPVLSNLGELADPLPLASRKPQMVLYDNVGRNPRTRSLAVNLVRRACERMGIKRLVPFGAGMPRTGW